MDGGEKQMAMTQAIKAQVKQGAITARRSNDAVIQVFSIHNGQPIKRSPTGPDISHANSTPAQIGAASTITTDESTFAETENFLITLYLDTIFPLLFPLYEPATLSGGRSWIPALLKANKAVFHGTISLGAYYFTLLLAKDANHTLRTPCEQHVWDTLANHMDLSIQVIKQDMDRYHADNKHLDVSSKLHVLAGVVQYLIFATTMPQGADWKIHLAAALTLLYEMLQSNGEKTDEYHLESILKAMDKPSIFDGIHLGFHVWNNDQAAFLFFTSFLLYADIMASIQLGRQPSQLVQSHYKGLVATREASLAPDGRDQKLLEMKTYVGCHGWVLAVLSDISALEITKRYTQSKGGYLPTEFIDRGHELIGRLQEGLTEINARVQSEFLTTQQDPFNPGEQINTNQTKKHDIITKIWLHAAIIYLSVVMEGWQTSNSIIRDNVNSILSILDILSAQLLIHSAMWPLCVSGFLAMPEQEHTFRGILSAPGPLQALGPARHALQLMERVWELRDGLNKDTWGIYECFQISEAEVLFI